VARGAPQATPCARFSAAIGQGEIGIGNAFRAGWAVFVARQYYRTSYSPVNDLLGEASRKAPLAEGACDAREKHGRTEFERICAARWLLASHGAG
jgi:hypothetical protein